MVSASAEESTPKLILHVDIRNTLFVADSIGHILVEQGINSYLTGVAWGIVKNDTWQLISDKPSLKPPSPGAITYYKYLETLAKPSDVVERAKLRLATTNFVDEPIGRVFKPVFDKCLENLKWEYARDDSITAQGLDGQNYHYIVRSFLNLLHYLNANRRDFAVILRTFGIDAKGTLLAFESTINKKHPEFPEGLGPIDLCNTIYNFNRRLDDSNNTEMTLSNSETGTTVCRNEAEILQWMCSSTGVRAIKDDFFYWQSQNFVSSAGKPFWVCKGKPQTNTSGAPCYHIIIDDNIRTWEKDSIVNFRQVENGLFQDMPIADVAQLEHVCFEQANLIEAICDPGYFIDIVSSCENNIRRMYDI